LSCFLEIFGAIFLSTRLSCCHFLILRF